MVKHGCHTHRSAPPPPGVSLKKVGFSELLCKPSGRHERTRLKPAETGTPSPGMAPSREDDGGYGADDGPPPQRAVGVEAPREGVEGEKYYAPRRPKPPRRNLLEVAEPQARLGQHSGIGCELVLARNSRVDASCAGFPRGCGREGPGGVVHGAGPFWLLHVPGLCADAGGRSAEARCSARRVVGGRRRRRRRRRGRRDDFLALRVPRLVFWVLPEEYTVPSSSHCLDLQWIQVPALVPEAFWDEFHTVST